jgi:GNAT superfamily N-acetyltransferase
MIDGKVAGYGWLSTGPEWIGELQLEIRPAKAQGYIWNCVTLPAYRRRGVFKALVAGISDAAHGLGIERLWIGTVAIPGESAVPRLGFRPAMTFEARKLGGWLVLTARSADIALAADARRVVNFRSQVRFHRTRKRRH